VTFNPTSRYKPNRILGHTIEGVFQQFVLFSAADLSEGMVQKVSADLPNSLCALIEPLATVVYAQGLVRTAISVNSVAIFGAGTIGLLEALLWRITGVRQILVLHPSQERLRWTVSQGISEASDVFCTAAGPDETVSWLLRSTSGLGVDAACLCTPSTGTMSALQVALRAVRPEGCIDLFGGVPESANSPWLPGVDLGGIRRANLCGLTIDTPYVHVVTPDKCPLWLTGHRGAGAQHTQAALELLQRYPALFSPLITQVVSMRRAADALSLHARTGIRRLLDEEWIKLVIDFNLK
jgi:threonine dehydrogenase-like Zn-dependent dehydrogenase